jgi:hypothetical protein
MTEAGPMTDHDGHHGDEDATSVDAPTGSPPDEGMTYDPEMTEGDEANIPAESEADPAAAPE